MTNENQGGVEALLESVRSDLSNIARFLEDEGDRVYLASSNDADLLREVHQRVENFCILSDLSPSEQPEPVAWRYRPRAAAPNGAWSYAGGERDYDRDFLDVQPLYAQPSEQTGGGGEDREVQYEVWQGDDMVASADALSDAEHYLMIYSQDGPTTLKEAVTVRRALSPTEAPEHPGDAAAVAVRS